MKFNWSYRQCKAVAYMFNKEESVGFIAANNEFSDRPELAEA